MHAIQDELINLTLHFSRGDGLQPTAIKQLRIARSDCKTEPMHTVYTPSLCFIVQGEKETMVAGKAYRYTSSEYLVNSVDLPCTGQVMVASANAPYLCLVLDIEPALVYELLRDAYRVDPTCADVSPAIFIDKVNPDLTDAALRLLRTLKSPHETGVLAPLIVREIVYRLLHSKYGGIVQQLGVAGSRVQRISQVIERLKTDFAQPLRIDDLAKLAGMSPSSFHQHFKTVTTMSPLQFQKQLRLQEARRLLATENTDAATTAFRVGYESPSQFSREYTRLFGLPPITDIKRLRAS